MMYSVELAVEAYASLSAELAASGVGRDAVLSAHGLSEERWQELDLQWQQRLSEALDGDIDGLPELVARHAAAYGEAQRRFAKGITLEEFALVTRSFKATGDLQASLAAADLRMCDYARGCDEWTRRIIEEPAIEQRFEAVMRGEQG